MGDRFRRAADQVAGAREDFLEVEAALGVELLFPDPSVPSGRPAFENVKRKRRQSQSPMPEA